MSNGPVRESKYQTCICGKECKGRAALANHGRKCDMERVRSALTIYCTHNNLKTPSDAWLIRNYDQVRTRLIELEAKDGNANLLTATWVGVQKL